FLAFGEVVPPPVAPPAFPRRQRSFRAACSQRSLRAARIGPTLPYPLRPAQHRGPPWVCAKFIGEKPAGYQPAARCSQNSSQRPLSWEQRRAIIALAWLTVQRIPDCFSRCPMIVLQPASTTPEPTKRPWLRNWA